jgi:hypothetical protein
MNTEAIIRQLEAQLDRLSQGIETLQGSGKAQRRAGLQEFSSGSPETNQRCPKETMGSPQRH